MAEIIYTSDGKALEYTFPDGYSGSCITITPYMAKGGLCLLKGIDYQVMHEVIRFRQPLPEGTEITISEKIQSIPLPGTANEGALQELSEASIANSASIAEADERYRAKLAELEARIAGLEA